MMFALLTLHRAPLLKALGSLNIANVHLLRSPLASLTPTDPRRPCSVPAGDTSRLAEGALTRLERVSRASDIASRSVARLTCLTGHLPQSAILWQQVYARVPADTVTAYYYALTSYALGHPVHTRFDRDISTYAVKRGRVLQTEKNVEAAQAWYEFALSLYPNTSAAAYLAGIYRGRQELDNALAVWDDVIARLSPESPEHWWARGQRAELKQNWEEAALDYEQAARRAQPGKAYSFYLTAGDRWVRVKAYDRAEADYRRALDLQPDSMAAYLRLGNLARAQKDDEGAIAWYKRAQEVAPTSYVPPYYMGLTAREQRQYEDALRYFDQALELAPKRSGIWYYKALTLDALNRRVEALAALNQAITLHSNPPKSWLDLQAHWQKYPDKKRDPNYWWNRGRFQEQKRLWHTAAGFYHQGARVAQPPDDYPLLMREALMWRYLRQPDRAEPIYRDLVTRYPDRMDAYIGLGDLARGRRAWDEATDWYKKAWRAAPDHHAPPYYLGVTAYSAKRYQEALEYLQRSLALNPKAAWTWYYKALALKALARNRDAIAALEQAISLYKNPPAGWVKTLEQWREEGK